MDEKIWWYALNNEQKGPISLGDLRLILNQNIINRETLVWKQGFPNWLRYSETESISASTQTSTYQTNVDKHENDISKYFDDKLFSVDQFYQVQFEKIKSSHESFKGNWNWWAFLFGPFWCLYKRLWAWGVIILLSSLLINLLEESGIGGLIWSFIWMSILGIRGTWFYYNYKVKDKQIG